MKRIRKFVATVLAVLAGTLIEIADAIYPEHWES